MFTTKTTKTIIKTAGSKAEKVVDSMIENMDSVFEKFDDTMKAFSKAAKEMTYEVEKEGEEKEEKGSLFHAATLDCSCLNDGSVQITTNNGHIVIEGDVKSLKVNGEDIEFEDE